MNKRFTTIFLFLCFVLMFPAVLMAQRDCSSAILLCGDTTISHRSGGVGQKDFVPNSAGTPCWSIGRPAESEKNPMWYYILIEKDGTLAFTIDADNSSNFDFALWKEAPCGNFRSVLSCNRSTVKGPTGIIAKDTLLRNNSPWNNCFKVKAGEGYYLLIDTQDSNGKSYTFKWTGTARLNQVKQGSIEADVQCQRVVVAGSAESWNNDINKYEWSVKLISNGSLIDLPNMKATGQKAIFKDLPLGSYRIVMEASTASGSKKAFDKVVRITETLDASFSASISCNKFSLSSKNFLCDAPVIAYKWKIKNLTTGKNDTISGKKEVVYEADTGKYNIELEIMSKDSIVAKASQELEYTPPLLFFSDYPAQKCFLNNASHTISVYANSLPKGIDKYKIRWSNAQGSVLSDTSTLKINKAGTYCAELTYGAGCKLRQCFDVTEACAAELFIPGAFSPNNDGLNDTYRIWGKRFKNLEVRIYNRLGELIFLKVVADDSAEVEWDGTINGKEAPMGVYACQLSYIDEEISTKVNTSRTVITLIR